MADARRQGKALNTSNSHYNRTQKQKDFHNLSNTSPHEQFKSEQVGGRYGRAIAVKSALIRAERPSKLIGNAGIDKSEIIISVD